MPALATRLRLRYRKSHQARGARGTRDTRSVAFQQASTLRPAAFDCQPGLGHTKADQLSYCLSCGAVRRAPGGRALLASERASIAFLRLRRSFTRLRKEALGRASLVRWVRVIMSFAQAL